MSSQVIIFLANNPKYFIISNLVSYISLPILKTYFIGAGISTESGLPDYRSEGVGLYAKKDHKVTQHQTFVKSLKARKSYWARNFVGWPRWSQVLPNNAHKTLGSSKITKTKKKIYLKNMTYSTQN